MPAIYRAILHEFVRTHSEQIPLHPERYYPHARIRVFHHSAPEIPGSAREGKPRSFFLCFEILNLRYKEGPKRRLIRELLF